MSEEELRKIAKEEMSKSIMNNLDSALIFKYIRNLEKENEELRNFIQDHGMLYRRRDNL